MLISATFSDVSDLGTGPFSRLAHQSSRAERRARWRAAPLFILLVIVILVPTECLADRWYKDYEKAVDLIGDGECSREAIRLLGAAVVDKPRPRLNARTIAVQTVDYLPYFQLARAHLACGELESARHYLGVSRQEGVAPADQLSALEQRLAAFESPPRQDAEPDTDLEPLEDLVGEVTENIRQGISLAAQVNSHRGNEQFTELFRNNASRLEQAAQDLQAAQEQLSEGTLRRDRSTIENANATALRSLEAFSSIVTEITELLRATPTPRPVVVLPSPSATPTSPPLARPTRAAVLPTPSPSPIPIRQVSRTPVDRSRGVSETLQFAAGEFLRAEYENLVLRLKPGALANTRERAAAHLLRAASNFALYCLGGREDEDQLGQARLDLGLCRDLDPVVQPDPRFFSPEFINLFRSTR